MLSLAAPSPEGTCERCSGRTSPLCVRSSQCPFLGLELARLFESRERGVPERVEPASQGFDAAGVDRVEAARAFGPVRHEMRILEDLEVLRDRGPRDLHAAADLRDGAWPPAKPPEDGAAGRIAEGVEDL